MPSLESQPLVDQTANNQLAIVNSARLAEYLMQTYGEPSHHVGVSDEARFEATDLDGRDYKILLTQRGVGATAVFTMHAHETLDGGFQSIYRYGIGEPTVQHVVKSKGAKTPLAFGWPQNATADLLYDCIDHKVY